MAERKSLAELKKMANDSKREMPHVKAIKAHCTAAMNGECHKQISALQKNACDYCMGKTKNASGTRLK